MAVALTHAERPGLKKWPLSVTLAWQWACFSKCRVFALAPDPCCWIGNGIDR